MVLFRFEYDLWFLASIRFHNDDASAFHQLQAQVSGPSTLANAFLQVPQYVHRRHICIHHQNASDVSPRLF